MMHGQKNIKFLSFFLKSRLIVIVKASTHHISALTLSNPVFQVHPLSFRVTSLAVRKAGTILHYDGKSFNTGKLARAMISCSISRSRIW